MNHYDIVIATPGSMITNAFVRSLTKTIKVLEENKITWQFVNYESPTLRHARERVINDRDDDQFDSELPFSGQFTYNKIMWIDSDIQWEPEDLLKLYRSEREIISGAYLQTNGTVAVSFDETSSPYPYQIPTARESIVTSCGFGFLCVKQGVFEVLPRPWFDNFLFNKDGTVASYATEDSAWCAKARAHGFKIWLDPNVRVIHNKTMSLAWLD
jgi:hypothetical protein